MTEITNKIITKIYNTYINFRLRLMGIKKDVVKKQGGIVYYEGGSLFQDTIVLLHGFADSKNGHLMVANKLLSNYRVLIPDLPGFGENTRNYHDTYSIFDMSEKVIELLREKKLEKVHVLGNSLGGAVAMGIATRAPELVKSLVLVGSAGFYSPDIQTVQDEFLKGDYIFQVNSDDEFKKLVERVFAKPPRIPWFLFNYLSKEFQENGKWYRKLLNDLVGEDTANKSVDELMKDSFNDQAREFSMSTLLLWGEEDRLFPPQIGEFANAIIPNSKLKILNSAGHAPQHENLPDYMDALLVFLKENESNNNLMREL